MSDKSIAWLTMMRSAISVDRRAAYRGQPSATCAQVSAVHPALSAFSLAQASCSPKERRLISLRSPDSVWGNQTRSLASSNISLASAGPVWRSVLTSRGQI